MSYPTCKWFKIEHFHFIGSLISKYRVLVPVARVYALLNSWVKLFNQSPLNRLFVEAMSPLMVGLSLTDSTCTQLAQSHWRARVTVSSLVSLSFVLLMGGEQETSLGIEPLFWVNQVTLSSLLFSQWLLNVNYCDSVNVLWEICTLNKIETIPSDNTCMLLWNVEIDALKFSTICPIVRISERIPSSLAQRA